MRRSTLDFYVARSSPVHRLPATLKLGISLLLIVAAALTPRPLWPCFLAVIGLLLCVIPLAHLPFTSVIMRLLLLEPFAAGVAVLALLQPHGGIIFLSLMLKSSLCLLTMIILTGTTSFSSLLSALTAWRVPKLLTTTLALLYRYLFVLFDDLTRMRMARQSRTFIQRRSRTWYLLSTMVAQLFVRAFLRAERIYAAMSARGWNP